jgi:hypothetical protein
VSTYVTAAIEAIPAQLYLGEIGQGMSVKSRFVLRFGNPPPESIRDALVEHDLPGTVIVRVLKSDGHYWPMESELKLNVDAEPGYHSGRMYLSFSGAALPAVVIPVRYKVVPR